jgi:hypothetical protein
MSSGHQPRLAGHCRGRLNTNPPSSRLPTRSRPSDNAPAEYSCPTCLIATKADAQRTTVTAAAPTASRPLRVFAGSSTVVMV